MVLLGQAGRACRRCNAWRDQDIEDQEERSKSDCRMKVSSDCDPSAAQARISSIMHLSAYSKANEIERRDVIALGRIAREFLDIVNQIVDECISAIGLVALQKLLERNG